jgi:hypothetical protein
LFTLIGAVVAVVAGLGLAVGGSAVLVDTSDPDTAPQVVAKIDKKFDPLLDKGGIYGSR